MQSTNGATPPRDEVCKFERSRFDLGPAQSEFEAAFNEYAGLGVEMCRALAALRTSRERYQGVEVALEKVKGRHALTQKLRRRQIAQADAIVHNSLACAQLGEEQIALAPRVNAEWQRVSEELRRLPPPTPEQMQKAAADMREASVARLREKFKLSDSEIAIVSQRAQDSGSGPKEPPPIPKVLLDDDWKRATEQMAAQHRKVAEASTRLKERLEQASGGGSRRATA